MNVFFVIFSLILVILIIFIYYFLFKKEIFFNIFEGVKGFFFKYPKGIYDSDNLKFHKPTTKTNGYSYKHKLRRTTHKKNNSYFDESEKKNKKRNYSKNINKEKKYHYDKGIKPDSDKLKKEDIKKLPEEERYNKEEKNNEKNFFKIINPGNKKPEIKKITNSNFAVYIKNKSLLHAVKEFRKRNFIDFEKENLDTSKDFETYLKEKIISFLEGRYLSIKDDLSQLRRKGKDVKIIEFQSMSLPLKIKIFKSTFDNNDLEKIFSIFDKVEKEIKEMENSIKNKNNPEKN